MESRVSGLLIITLLYGLIYSSIPPEEFGFKSAIDPLYFSFTTMSTVGYGDISPKTDRAKLIVMSQQTAILMEIANIIHTLLPIKK